MRREILSALVVSAVVASAAQAAVSNLLVFGDSLSDVGNIALATGGAVPGPAYFNGRFSNGPIWVDQLASNLGVPVTTPSFVPGGNNFALGGSRVNDPAIFQGQAVPSFAAVTQGFLTATPSVSADTLVTIWIGSNDFLNAAETTPNPVAMANTVASFMQQMVSKGARQFALFNLAPIGNTPAIAAGGPFVTAAINAGVQQYNTLLAGVAANIDALPAVQVNYIDTYSLFQNLISNPTANGLTNITTPALGQVGINADTYLWWDTVHPTRVGHAALGLAVSQAIPEPTAALPMVAALGGLLARRRK